ncbi:MAG TPA: B-box zinc finger protein [Bacteroidota bacterium]|nr:B-box zinc finger protein [Bacteroidota bacterium]
MTRAKTSATGHGCDLHPSNPATGRCVVCGRPLCDECSERNGKDLFCRGTDHRSTAEGWAVIASAGSEFEADAVSRNLNMQGVQTKVFSSRVFTYTLERNPADAVRTYVRRHELQRAREILRNLGFENKLYSEMKP